MLFIVMELLTVLAYPIILVQVKIRQLSTSKQGTPHANKFVKGSITPGR
jgi:hypothetical protein